MNTQDTKDTLNKAVIVFLLIFISVPIIGFLHLIIFYKLWNWLIVPVLSVKSLTLLQAFALTIFYNFMTGHFIKTATSYKNKSFSEIFGELFGVTVLIPLFYLFLGYIVHFFL